MYGQFQSLIPLYQSFAKRNEALNEEAVKSALEFYNTHIPQDMDVYMRHEDIEAFAMRHFRMRRRPGRNYIEDPYLDDLKKVLSLLVRVGNRSKACDIAYDCCTKTNNWDLQFNIVRSDSR